MPTDTTDEQEQTASQAPPEGDKEKPETAMTRTGAMEFGLLPRNFDEAWRMAGILARSLMVPKNYQQKPEDVLVAMMYGAEIGLPPMAALQSVAVINGKPGLYGDGFLGVIMSKPTYARHVEYYELADGQKVRSLKSADYTHDETKAVAQFWRKGNPEPFVAEFSIGDAKRAKLWGKEGPWSSYPGRQLLWRARGYAGRNGFAAELRGVKTAEELIDTPNDLDAEYTVSTVPIEPVRRSEKAAAAPAPVDAPATDVTDPPPPATRATTPAKPPAAATRKPESKSQPGNGPSVVTENLVVTATAYVSVKGQDPYWEIKASTSGEPPVAMTFVTVEEAAYKLAESCEGTGALVNVRWHGGKRQDGSACKVLETIVAAN